MGCRDRTDWRSRFPLGQSVPWADNKTTRQQDNKTTRQQDKRMREDHMTIARRHEGCCPLTDPCPRHVHAALAGGQVDRARAVDGVAADRLGELLDLRALSRRAVFGAGAAGALFAAGAPALARSVTGPASAHSAVFAGAPLGRMHELPSTKETVRVGAMDP